VVGIHQVDPHFMWAGRQAVDDSSSPLR
jgi:hypothetical protein